MNKRQADPHVPGQEQSRRTSPSREPQMSWAGCSIRPSELPAFLPNSPSWTSLNTVTNGGSSAGPRREGQFMPLQSTPATSGPPPPSNLAHPATAPTRPRRQQPRTPASTQPPSSPPLSSGGLPSWAIVSSPEPGPWGRTQPRPVKPAPKPRLTLPSAPQQNSETRK